MTLDLALKTFGLGLGLDALALVTTSLKLTFNLC